MAEELRDPPIIDPPIRLAVCVSGEGTTLQNLIDRIRSRKLRAELIQVVASRPRIGAIAAPTRPTSRWLWPAIRPARRRSSAHPFSIRSAGVNRIS